jgi:hypothetical protein
VQELNPLLAGLPRWAAARPHLAGRLLLWRNAYRFRRRRTLAFAALIAVGCGAVVALPPTGPILGWLGGNWAVTFVIATCAFALSTARRRQRAAIDATTSWLASLPPANPVRLQIVAATAGWLAAIVAVTALVWATGAIDRVVFSRFVLAAAAGTIVGLLAGWRLPRAGIGAPGFHYAIVRRARDRWASAPSLSPLGCWAAAQGRVFSRPRKTAPVVLLAMMAVPSGLHGTPAGVVFAVVGVCMALFSVVSLSAAVVRIAFEAARWLAPTTVGWWRFTGALIWRAVLTQAMVLVVVILLAGAVAPQRALAVGVPLMAICLVASLAAGLAACFLACRRVGLGRGARGGSSDG